MVKRIIKEKREFKEFYWLWLVAFIFACVLLIVILQIYQHKKARDYNPLTIKKTEVINEIDTKDFVSSTSRQLVKLSNGEKNLVAVMIDNHFEAWDQQFGLAYAPIVYNIPVEGGTTRLMAIFDIDNEVDLIGPVRSVRPYFLDYLREYDALLVHVGGSPDALQIIEEDNLDNLNEMTGLGQYYFFRNDELMAPHNTYTDTEKLSQALIDLDYLKKISRRQINYDSNVITGLNDQNIFIDYSSRSTYDINYQWDVTRQGYLRWRAQEPHLDQLTGEPLVIDNIVILKVPAEKVLDELLRIDLDVLQSGEALYFKNGELTKGSWEKDSPYSATKYFDEQGQEYRFRPGNIWIEVVPFGHAIEIN